MSARLLVLLAVASTAACDCERRELESRLDALEAEGDAVLEEVELASIAPGYPAVALGEDATRVIVTMERAVLDASRSIRAQLAELGQGRGVTLPRAPSTLHVMTELDEGRLDSLVVSPAGGPGTNVAIDVYADRRVSWPVMNELVRSLASAGYVNLHIVVAGAEGPQRLPIHQVEIGERYCVLGAGPVGAEPGQERGPARVTPLERMPAPDTNAHPCRYQRAVGVEIRDEGHWVVTGQGTLTPECSEARIGGSDDPTVARDGDAFDYDALAICLRRLRALSPNDVYVQLSARGERFTVADYAGTWEALRGPPSGPIFEEVY